MKTRSFLAAAVVLISVTAFANNPRLTVVGQVKPGCFKVIYQGDQSGDVTLKIYDEAGETVFSNVTRGVNSFILPVNFSLMKTGEYTIEISDKEGSQAQKIVYAEAKSIENAHVSKLAESGKYLLAVPNDGTREIKVNIFDGNKNLVHSEDRTIQGDFGLVYALQNVSGIPTFEITEKSGRVYPLEY